MSILKNYSGIIWLLGGIVLGSVIGIWLGPRAVMLKPVGDIFLNLLFTAVIPLVFFAIASALADMDPSMKMGRVLGVMALVFLGTILLSAITTLAAVWIFPLHERAGNAVAEITEQPGSIGEQITRLLTVSEFYDLLSRRNMLPFIIFSALTGFAAMLAGSGGTAFRGFLRSGNEVMKQLMVLIMKLAPVGLGAYFAYQAGVVGPQLFGTYAHSLGMYYAVGTFYFIAGFTFYAFIAGGVPGIRLFWRNNIIPTLTSLGTCSSIATIPANLEATRRMGVPDHVGSVVIPLGATLHKDGSSISSIIKIAAAFVITGKSLLTVDAIVMALGITVIVSIVEGGILNGGYIGEMLSMSVYGFPPEVLPAMMIIGTLVDPLATVLNATGDNVAAMMTTRFLRLQRSE